MGVFEQTGAQGAVAEPGGIDLRRRSPAHQRAHDGHALRRRKRDLVFRLRCGGGRGKKERGGERQGGRKAETQEHGASLSRGSRATMIAIKPAGCMWRALG